MKIVSKRKFEATASQLWHIVRDPGNMPAWNPKCVACTSLPQARTGERFSATYNWRDRTHVAEGEVLEYREGEYIAYRIYYEHSAKLGSVDESFQLRQLDLRRAELIHTVDFRRSTLPWWVKMIIGLAGRFGQRKGPDPLKNIEDLLQ